jgi:hypothetical protein
MPVMRPTPTAPSPLDQADGLRRLFAAARALPVAVVSNPHVRDGGLMLERLCSAFGEAGRNVLVIDAAERSPAPRELATVDLAACVEPLSRNVSYLAARGLALRHLDARGGAGGLLDAVAKAAPHVDVLLVHAAAGDLCRVFASHSHWRMVGPDGDHPLRPILLADDHPTSVTHAYAGMKWLASRGGLWVDDLLLAVSPRSPRARAIPRQLADCADRFVGAVLASTAWVDPDLPASAPAPDSLHELVAAQIDPTRLVWPSADSRPMTLANTVRVATPSRPGPPNAPKPTRTRHAFPER